MTRQRHRAYVHSPDDAYRTKLAELRRVIGEVAAADPRARVYFCDEWTIHNHAARGYDYRARGGHAQPRARLALGGERVWRIAGLLDALTGQVDFIARRRITTTAFVALLERAARHGGRAYVIVDNWPVHFHPDVIARLEPQRHVPPGGYHLPSSWRGLRPSERALRLGSCAPLAVQLLSLPTYSPWLNAIERLWGYLTPRLAWGHADTDNFPRYRAGVIERLERLASPSDEILSACGLLATNGVYAEARNQLVRARSN